MPLRYAPPLGGDRTFDDITAETACFGDGVNQSCFDENGWLQSEGDGRSWIDFNFGVGKVSLGASSPDLINLSGTNIETLAFDGNATTEEVSIVQEMNHQWAEGTIIKPHIHWYPTTNAGGNVRWQMEYVIIPAGGIVPVSTTIGVTQAAGGVAWTARFAAFADIDLAGFLIGSQLHVRFFRDPTDPADTYGDDAAIATFGLHVLVDSFGSRQPATK